MTSSLFSSPAAAAARSAALVPAGEVFGCVTMNLGYSGGGCTWWGTGSTLFGSGSESPITTSGRGGPNSSFSPYTRAVEGAWATALQRMLAEAGALGAHGVVGVRMERTLLDGRAFEFTALGTAVRSTDFLLAPRSVQGHVWSTSLSAEDTSAAILSGFIPHEILVGLSVSTKHEDWQLKQQRTGWTNQEVTGMSQLIQAARNEARVRVQNRATHSGAAELVVTEMSLFEFETPCGSQDGRDYHAEATVIGSSLVPVPRFHKRPPESSRVQTVLSLRDG